MTTVLDRPSKQQPQGGLAPVGWSAARELAYDEWLRQGSRLGMAGRNASWWIGDWLRYGAARYGTKYSAAARVTGYDRQTLMNMVYVATGFEISRRRENLSWSHHAEVASLEIDAQERWLDHAAAERLSVRDLRDELGSVRRPTDRPGRPRGSTSEDKANGVALTQVSDAATERVVVCPHCGHKFAP